MNEIVMTASEANRGFSRLLRLVAGGAQVRVTSHGRTVALVKPPEQDEAERRCKNMEWIANLEKMWAEDGGETIGPWTREQLYERG